MKRKHYISFLIILSGLILCAWIYHTPHPLPYSQCSEIYQQYSHTPGVSASFIKDFPINDSVAVDVTLLRFQDSTTWLDNIYILHELDKEEDFNPLKISFKIITKDDEQYLIAANSNNLTIGVFPIKTDQQFEAIFDNYFNQSYN